MLLVVISGLGFSFIGLLRSSKFTATQVTSFLAAHTLLSFDDQFAPGMSCVDYSKTITHIFSTVHYTPFPMVHI